MTPIGFLMFLAYFISAVLVWVRVDWSAGVFAMFTFLLVTILTRFGNSVRERLESDGLAEDIAEAIVNVAKGSK